MADYELGARFVGRADRSIIATVTDKKLICNLPHYKLSIAPNLYNAQSTWLSEYGILLGFFPQSYLAARAKKKREGFLRFFRKPRVKEPQEIISLNSNTLGSGVVHFLSSPPG